MRIRASFVAFLSAAVLCNLQPSAAGPIIKPMKYHGPIPKKSFSLRIGFLGGATNEEMWDKLDALVEERQGGEPATDDFGNGLSIDGTLTFKMHPRFAVRNNVNFSSLRSMSDGQYIPPPDTAISPIAPVRNFHRSFDVDIISLSGDAIYFFTDASVKEFQPYMGGGFSIWFPRAKYTEELTDVFKPPGSIEPDTVVVRPKFEKTDWSIEAGVQGIIGFNYYITNTISTVVEARYHIAQSTFTLNIPTVSGNRDVNFIVKYTGFIASAGIKKAF